MQASASTGSSQDQNLAKYISTYSKNLYCLSEKVPLNVGPLFIYLFISPASIAQSLRAALAEAAILPRHPILAPDSRSGIKYVIGVVAVLDSLQSVVVASIEYMLPIRLLEVSLVEIRAAAWCKFGELGNEDIGYLILSGLHVRQRYGVVIRSVFLARLISNTSSWRGYKASVPIDGGKQEKLTSE